MADAPRTSKDGPLKREEYDALREHKDPCIKEHEMSLKCLDESGYDRDKCETFFTNYRNCKKFWGFITKSRKRQGISPALPPLEEREQVKQEYLEQMRRKF